MFERIFFSFHSVRLDSQTIAKIVSFRHAHQTKVKKKLSVLGEGFKGSRDPVLDLEKVISLPRGISHGWTTHRGTGNPGVML